MWKRLLAIGLIATTTTCGPAQKPDTIAAPAPVPGAARDVATSGPAAPEKPVAPPEAVRAKAVETPALVPTPLAGDATKTTIHRLSNGMTVYLSPDPQEPSVVAHVVVRAGSRNDSEQSAGLAHYLEHMLFKGIYRRYAPCSGMPPRCRTALLGLRGCAHRAVATRR